MDDILMQEIAEAFHEVDCDAGVDYVDCPLAWEHEMLARDTAEILGVPVDLDGFDLP
jgi:hypothetical protein